VKPTAEGHVFKEVDLTPFLGKRVRVSAYLKSEKLTNWAGLGLVGMAAEGKWVVFDSTSNRVIRATGTAVDRTISGTSDWKKMESVADIPAETAKFMVGVQLHGGGKLWIDDLRVEIVTDDVPTTDDNNLHLYCAFPKSYTATHDDKTKHGDVAALCLASAPAGPGTSCVLGTTDRHPDQYLGHRIRFSTWAKTDELTGGANLRIVAAIPHANDRQINEGMEPTASIVGSQDWKQYEVTADVPPETQCLMFNIDIGGRGKVWIDGTKVEVLDVPATTQATGG
jgi:hypothetical protein